MSIDPVLVAWTPALVIGFVYGLLLAPRMEKPYRRKDDYIVLVCGVLGVVATASFSMWWEPLNLPQQWGGQPPFIWELLIALMSAFLRMLVGLALSLVLIEGFFGRKSPSWLPGP